MLRALRISAGRLAVGFLPEVNDALSAESLTTLKRNFGLAPRVYRAQMLRPDLVDAQVQMVDRLLFSKGALSRVQKEFILLVVSAENNNSYFPALHCQTLQFLGVKPEHSQQVVIDHREANLSDSDVALLDFSRKLASRPHSFTDSDVESLRKSNFNDEQILEAVLMVGLTQLFNCVKRGLGTEPDLKPRTILPIKYRVAFMLSDLEDRPTDEAAAALGLSIPGLKARVLRGRLMLRESMVQYFSKTGAGDRKSTRLNSSHVSES